MKVIECVHTAILVSDLQKAEHFYSHVLGLQKVDRPLKFPGIWYQIQGYQIHLMEDSLVKIKLYNPNKWGRNAHIALSVEDLETAIARLADYHCPIQMSQSGRPALFTQDPDGNIIEINQG